MSESSQEININIPGLIVSSLIEIFFPLVLSFIWIKYFYGKLTCILMGFAGFVSSVGCEAIFISLISKIFHDNFLFYIIVGISPGIFEETGRYICLKYLLGKNKNQHNNISVSYGIGHGGIESILIGISLLFKIFIKDRLIKEGEITESISFYIYIMSAWERFFSVLFHISASIFVFNSINEQKMDFYIFAIFIHDFIDLFSILYRKNIIKNLFIIELIIAIISSSFSYFAYKFYRILDVKKEEKEEEKVFVLKERKGISK